MHNHTHRQVHAEKHVHAHREPNMRGAHASTKKCQNGTTTVLTTRKRGNKERKKEKMTERKQEKCMHIKLQALDKERIIISHHKERKKHIPEKKRLMKLQD